MKIAILGTRGIPNHYGGFEQCAEYLALGLVQKGHEVTVYNSHNHPYKDNVWKGVQLVRKYDPENKIGTAGQFIYDLNCILDSRKKKFDIILQLGYTSSSIWGWLFNEKCIVTTNMDGLEWKRTKFSGKVQKFLLWAENLAVKYSDYLISDSVGIQDYLKSKYNLESEYIPYGAHVFNTPSENVLEKYKLERFDYDLLIARLEPENSIEVILNGVVESNLMRNFLVIGNHNTKYGEYLKNKFRNNTNIFFLGGIYNIEELNSLRYFSNIYFHGHTVGGTNPSLLEAMASNSLICANENTFNRYILGDDAFYFKNEKEVTEVINTVSKLNFLKYLSCNTTKIEELYTWEKIVEQYENHFEKILSTKDDKLSIYNQDIITKTK